jgi:hypothetical protein
MSTLRKLTLGTVATVAAIGGAATLTSGEASAALAPCRDSNGRKPGGMVYVYEGRSLGCDVSRPQTLTVLNIGGRAKCDDAGGRYFAIGDDCYRVDY